MLGWRHGHLAARSSPAWRHVWHPHMTACYPARSTSCLCVCGFADVCDVWLGGCRGVDIPAALITLVPGACALAPLPTPSASAGTAGGAGGASPDAANGANHGASKAGSSWPLPSGRGCAVQQAHSAAHLVPLPIPDLSMPFNVCCFTSTVLAVYFGGVLNSLLR